MAKDQKNEHGVLPHNECLLVLKTDPKKGQYLDIVNLDEYCITEDDAGIKKDIYLKTINVHGQNNVRYCRMVPVSIKQVVEIDE